MRGRQFQYGDSMPAKKKKPKKSELILLKTQGMTADDLDRFYERLTGKKVTPEEHAQGVALVAKLNKRKSRRRKKQ